MPRAERALETEEEVKGREEVEKVRPKVFSFLDLL
jgi:hypothetical protein